MIPKILHYIWLGGDKTALVEKCIDSFYKYLPDYEIKEWNESNIDITSYSSLLKRKWEESYQEKKYAYCSDITRLYVMKDYGGIYVDTDVEFIKPIQDSFLEKSFLCRIHPTQDICNGCIWGCGKEDTLASGSIIWFEKKLNIAYLEYGRGWIFNHILNTYFELFGYDRSDTCSQDILDYRIYPTNYFNPKSIFSKNSEVETTENTISIHHYNKSWV